MSICKTSSKVPLSIKNLWNTSYLQMTHRKSSICRTPIKGFLSIDGFLKSSLQKIIWQSKVWGFFVYKTPTVFFVLKIFGKKLNLQKTHRRYSACVIKYFLSTHDLLKVLHQLKIYRRSSAIFLPISIKDEEKIYTHR